MSKLDDDYEDGAQWRAMPRGFVGDRTEHFALAVP
jgi:hypothetical protein